MSFCRKWSKSAAVLALILAAPPVAQAHLVTTGMGPVYDGIGHWSSTPEDVLPVLAVAILAGLRGPAAGRQAIFTLPATWLLGGLVGMLISSAPELSRPVLSGIIAATFLVPGLLALSDLAVPTMVVTCVAAFVGLIHGFFDAGGLREEGAATSVGILQIIGMSVILFLLVTLLSALVISLRKPWWLRIVARVAGSWIAAAGLLLLGWSLRGVG
jgi:hydrogenase/urease accessory protein HupE